MKSQGLATLIFSCSYIFWHYLQSLIMFLKLSLLLLLFGSLLLTVTATRSGQWIALVFLFNNLLRREEKLSMFSHLYITAQHYSMSILFTVVSIREENVWKEKEVLKVQKKDKAFLPWLLKCCALSWTSGHWLPCNQNQKLAKGMFVLS